MVAEDHTLGFRVAVAQAGSRPDHARTVGGVPALPGDGHDRDPQGRQRPIHVLAGRQSARRAGPRTSRVLGGLRRDGGTVAGWRRGSGPRDLDDRGRPGRFRDGYLGDGCRALWRLRHACLHQREGPGELPPPVPHHVPERGTARGPAAAHDPHLRPAHRRERRLGRDLRARSTRCGSSDRVSSRRRT